MENLLKSKRFHYLLGWLVSGGLILWIVLVMDWQVVIRELADVNYLILIPMTLLFWVQLALRAFRWRHLLPDGGELSYSSLMDALMLGNFATCVLPLRAGEFIRPYVLSNWSGRKFLTLFISVVVERFFDLTLVLLSFGIVALTIPGLPPWAFSGAKGLGFLALALFCFMAAGSYFPEPVLKLAAIPFKFLPAEVGIKAEKFFGDLLTGAKVLREHGNLVFVAVYTACIWLLTFYYFQIGASMFSVAGSAWVGVAVGVTIALAVAAPSAPGFLGVFQTGCIAGLALFGVSKETAIAYSIVCHAHQFLFTCGYGVYVLLKHNLKLSALKGAAAG